MRHFVTSSAIVLTAAVIALGWGARGQTDDDKEEKVYRHVVCFKFKEDASQEQVQEVVAAFAELPSKIDTIQDFEYGTNVSPEGLSKGYTHCFLVTFEDKAGLEAYLPHAAHQAFVAKLRPILEEAFVVDYVTGE